MLCCAIFFAFHDIDNEKKLGPAKSVSHSLCLPVTEPVFSSTDEERSDGRSSLNMQKHYMTLGLITHAEGSAYIEVGSTKVMCSVYGPKEVQRTSDVKLTGQVSCEVTFAPFAFKMKRSTQPDKLQKEMSRQLKDALETIIILEKFPKAQIDVCISVIEDGGSLFSTCLTASGLALCHSGIDMYDLIVGIDLIWKEGVPYINPTLQEEEFVIYQKQKGVVGSGTMTLGMLPKYAKGQIALMVHEGEMDVETLSEGITLATEACQTLYKIVRQVLLGKLEKVVDELSSSKSEALSFPDT